MVLGPAVLLTSSVVTGALPPLKLNFLVIKGGRAWYLTHKVILLFFFNNFILHNIYNKILQLLKVLLHASTILIYWN